MARKPDLIPGLKAAKTLLLRSSGGAHCAALVERRIARELKRRKRKHGKA